MVRKTPKCWMCGQKLTANWIPSVVDYHTGCYRVGCRHCGWATYLTSATEEQAIDSAKELCDLLGTDGHWYVDPEKDGCTWGTRKEEENETKS